MNKFISIPSMFLILIVCSALVQASDDPKYPAYEFEPKVLFLSPDFLENLAATQEQTKADKNYPALSFTPTVLYYDPKSIDQETDKGTPTPTVQEDQIESTNNSYISALPKPPNPDSQSKFDTFPSATAGLTVILVLGMVWLGYRKVESGIPDSEIDDTESSDTDSSESSENTNDESGLSEDDTADKTEA